jgi:hypothetical protein
VNLGCQDLEFPTANNIKAVTFTTLQNVIIMTPPDYSKTPPKIEFIIGSPLFASKIPTQFKPGFSVVNEIPTNVCMQWARTSGP